MWHKASSDLQNWQFYPKTNHKIMEHQQQPRTKWLTIRMSEEEYQAVEALSRQAMRQTLSEYARKTVLGKPIIMKYHDESMDKFIDRMIELKDELKSIGNNFNQVVRRLHSLKNLPDLQQWILVNEQEKTRIFRLIETISTNINEAKKVWSRE
jgi:hypothetical protein